MNAMGRPIKGKASGASLTAREGEQSENSLQHEIASKLRAAGFMVVAIPNGGKRRRREAAQMKNRAVRKGFPDLMVLMPHARVHFLELKTSKGRLSKEQIGWREWLNFMGFKFDVVRSADEALRLFVA